MERIPRNMKHSNPGLVLWLLLLPLLFAPLALAFFPSLSGEKLYGVQDAEKVKFSWHHIQNHEWQNSIEDQVKQNMGCANYWVRLHNELNFRLFRYTNAEKLVLGKNDCFYEEMYITEYLGHNYIGKDFVEKKVENLKVLQKLLQEKYGIELLLVFEPGKAHFSPENIPNRYQPTVKTTSNYEAFTAACDRAGVHYLDLNGYFFRRKATSPHPLYSKYGVHWSSYGLWQAADTLARYIEHECRINLPDIVFAGDSNSKYNKDLDFDMEPAMNLLFTLPHETLNFPICYFRHDDSSFTQPRVLTIADSYYWSIWNSGIAENLFSDNTFWYYNLTVYPNIWDPIEWVDKSKLKEVIENKDVILLMITDANLYNFGWQFVEEALVALDPNWKIQPDIAAFNCIMNTTENGKHQWYLNLLERSRRKQIPFRDVLREEVERIQ